MSDFYLKKFWNDVKDATWPEVSTWNDFYALDQHIQQECFCRHGLQQRLAEIENPDYWLPHALPGMIKKDRFVFIPLPKCGSAHYKDFFINRLGWSRFQPRSLDELASYVKFGLMMHPLDRYLKGLTEFAWRFEIKDQDLQRFVTSCFMPDDHAISYSLYLGQLLADTHWIPFQDMTDIEVKSCMNKLFHHYGSNIEIPITHPAIHVSPQDKKILYQKIMSYWHQRQEPEDSSPSRDNTNLYLIYKAHAKDLEFYRQLKNTFKSDWLHLKAH